MVWVPAGEFQMGSKNTDNAASSCEKPQHSILLDGYWIYKNDVTVAQYKSYCVATGAAMPDQGSDAKSTCPAVNVSWYDARAYAKWAECALPSEAQWEKAARGTDGRNYPWGDTWDDYNCNNDITGPGCPTPVGRFPLGASPYGCLDMAGNVWQWCDDWYDENYYLRSPSNNPTGPDSGEFNVLRGGCYADDISSGFYCAFRYLNAPREHDTGTGFRCVHSSPRPK